MHFEQDEGVYKVLMAIDMTVAEYKQAIPIICRYRTIIEHMDHLCLCWGIVHGLVQRIRGIEGPQYCQWCDASVRAGRLDNQYHRWEWVWDPTPRVRRTGMRIGFNAEHWDDANGNPAGGTTFGRGFVIDWQNGPLGRGAERREPNGAFVEDVIDACADRIRFYQKSHFACDRNARALKHLEAALDELDARTNDREARAVEGTHEE